MFLSVSNIKSSSVAELSINATTKQAVVRYHGSERPYLYTGVDFNALYNIVFNQVDSIGKWVNENLKSVASVECYAVWPPLFTGGYSPPFMMLKADYVFLNLAHESSNHECFYYFLSQFY